jgi:uridine kinase
MDKLLEIIATKKPKVGQTLFIAIDGHGGSGKSTLAKWLSAKLEAEIIRTDDFASWDNPLNWWPLVIERVFRPIQNGAATLSYPRSKWWENHTPEPVVNQPVTPIMILEGVSSSRSEFRDYMSSSIFVDAPKEICLQRGIERDSSTGKTKEELEKTWRAWFEEEDKYMQRDDPKTHACLIVDGTVPFEEQISV